MHDKQPAFAPLILSDEEVAFLFRHGPGDRHSPSLSSRLYIDAAQLGLSAKFAAQLALNSMVSSKEEDDPDPSSFGEPVFAMAALQGHDTRTTVMFRRVPRRLTQEDLRKTLESVPGVAGSIEFLYLPRDVARRSNRGFAFVNFSNSVALGILASLLCESREQLPQSLRSCQLFYARTQGQGRALQQLIEQRQFAAKKRDV